MNKYKIRPPFRDGSFGTFLVHKPHLISGNVETFIEIFRVIPKHSFQNVVSVARGSDCFETVVSLCIRRIVMKTFILSIVKEVFLINQIFLLEFLRKKEI